MPFDLSRARHAPAGCGWEGEVQDWEEEEEVGCNFQVKNRKKKRGEWTSGITEGREERANKLLARRKHNCLSTTDILACIDTLGNVCK